MEYLNTVTEFLPSIYTFGGAGAAFVTFSIIAALSRALFKKSYNLPPGPWALPILGNLTQLTYPERLHDRLEALAKEYGPIYTLWFGSVPTVVVTGVDVVKEATVVRGTKFINRIQLPSWDYLSGGCKTTLSSNGPHWVKMRKILTQFVLSPIAVASYKDVRSTEIGKLVDSVKVQLAKSETQVIEPLPLIRTEISSILIGVCFGKAITFDQKSVDLIDDYALRTLSMASHSHMGDFVPLTRFLPSVRATTKKYYLFRDEVNGFLLPKILKRKQQLESGEEPQNCFLDTLLSLKGDDKITDEEIIWNLMEALTGGIDTSTESIHWGLACLIAHPDAQRIIYEEILEVVGDKGQRVKEEHLKRLPYLVAFVKETFRLYMVSGLGIPHAATEDTKLGGYDIPATAQILFHAGAMGRNEMFWETPNEFKPERFLQELTDDQRISYIPFGGGRRICPGMNMGNLHVQYTLAVLVQEFEWSKEKPDRPVDFTSSLSFIVSLKNKVRAKVTARL